MKSLDSITRAFRRIALALGCALALGACTTWREAPPPAPAALREFDGPVRVIRHDGFSTELRDAYVRGDTLYGYDSKTRVAMPLRDVKAMETRKLDALRSIGAGVAYTVAALGALMVVVFYEMGRSRS